MIVAIDGPAGAGKSTVARAVAQALGFTYLDTGAMYRCVALARLRDPQANAAALEIALADSVTLNGEDVGEEIRSPAITELASEVAAEPEVRAAMALRQQAMLASGDWVAEGRDIGTVIAPQAELKIFLTADPTERARRRAEQTGRPLDEVLAEQQQRDRRDGERELSPLVAAADAVQLDTTALSADEAIAEIVELATQRSGGRSQ
ncbi:MAG: (d)CMP kinase [Solirubrobacteraceae bacterium]|nr:(d)CMP kinase [Solirubrobacteraceae bacterium]